MIKAVIFDWGGVLIDNPTEALMQYCADSLNADKKAFRDVYLQYESAFQKGTMPESELWNNICAKLNAKKPKVDSLWKEAVRHIFNDKMEVYDLVQLLKQKGYKTGFLSNTEIPTMEHFFENGYQKYFDATTFSCAENTAKPEEKIYRIVLNKLAVEPHETVFIDDKLPFIEMAKNIGMNGIVFKDVVQLKKELDSLGVHID